MSENKLFLKDETSLDPGESLQGLPFTGDVNFGPYEVGPDVAHKLSKAEKVASSWMTRSAGSMSSRDAIDRLSKLLRGLF